MASDVSASEVGFTIDALLLLTCVGSHISKTSFLMALHFVSIIKLVAMSTLTLIFLKS